MGWWHPQVMHLHPSIHRDSCRVLHSQQSQPKAHGLYVGLCFLQLLSVGLQCMLVMSSEGAAVRHKEQLAET